MSELLNDAPMSITEVNILATKGDLSVSIKAVDAGIGSSNATKVQWLVNTVALLEGKGFTAKAQMGGGRPKKEKTYIKAVCGCGGKMYVSSRGTGVCENYAAQPTFKHLYIRKEDMNV